MAVVQFKSQLFINTNSSYTVKACVSRIVYFSISYYALENESEIVLNDVITK